MNLLRNTLLFWLFIEPVLSAEQVVTFDELSGYTATSPRGSSFDGFGANADSAGWTSGGAQFNTGLFGPGWSYSNVEDVTTAGYRNQFAAITGSGASIGMDNYALAFGYFDLVATQSNPTPFDSMNEQHLRLLPSITLPDRTQAQSVLLTNTTYATLSMQNGDQFAKNFGGVSGNDPDFFKLSIFGIKANNQVIDTEIEFYLADFRFADSSQDYIIRDWTALDLSPLSEASSLHFNLSSSDNGNFGMNTPASFAIDNLTVAAVPEPSVLAVLFLSLAVTIRYRRK